MKSIKGLYKISLFLLRVIDKQTLEKAVLDI